MTQEHPITPPPELVQKWSTTVYQQTEDDDQRDLYIATQAARWGADMELEACEKYWMTHGISPEGVARMRAARRPKPPSLKEQALETLRSMQIPPCVVDGINVNADLMAKYDILRRALESLHS